MTRKLLIRDLHGDREVPLVDTITVGRDPACDIFDNDGQLSRRHAQFTVTAAGVVVRDLKSQNGVFVNGVRVEEAVLSPSDTIRIAHLTIALAQDVAVPPPVDATDDLTSVMDGPMAPGRPPRPPTDTDGTRLYVPGAERAIGPPVVAAPGVPAPAVEAIPLAPRVAAAGAVAGAAGGAAVAAAPAAVETATKAGAKARTARSSFAIRTMLVTTALSALVFLAGSLPVLWWHDTQLDTVALNHGEAVVNWVVAEARGKLEQGAPVTTAVEPVLRQPGVVAAMIVTPAGQILAPAARASETITAFDGLGVKVGEVYRLQSGRNGDLIELVRPVDAGDRPRAAVAWVAIRPADLAVDATGRAAVLAPVFLLSLLVGLAAGGLIARRTGRAIAQLNEDTELALAGRLDAVSDPLGAKPVRDLANTLNYLVTRAKVHGEEGLAPPPLAASPSAGAVHDVAGPAAVRGASRPPAVKPPKPQPAAVAPAAPDFEPVAAPVRVEHHEAQLVVSPDLSITSATGAFESLLGIEPRRLVGQHLFSALTDQTVLDAALRCLGALPPAGREDAIVERVGAPALRISVARQGKDQPLTIVLRLKD